jgi:hypothetical protein
MVDLQRRIANNGIPFAARCKTPLEIAIQRSRELPMQMKILHAGFG